MIGIKKGIKKTPASNEVDVDREMPMKAKGNTIMVLSKPMAPHIRHPYGDRRTVQ